MDYTTFEVIQDLRVRVTNLERIMASKFPDLVQAEQPVEPAEETEEREVVGRD